MANTRWKLITSLRRPSSSRKQSVTNPLPHNLLPNEHLVLTRSPSSRFLYTDAYGGNYPAGGDFHHEDEELRTAHQQASQYAGSSGNSEIFSNVINSISQKKGHLANSDIDEQGWTNLHFPSLPPPSIQYIYIHVC